MIETHKILAGVYDEDVGPKLPKGNSTTRGHSKKIFKRGSRLNIRKYFFTLRVATIWNELPEDIVNAKNTQAFKNALDNTGKITPANSTICTTHTVIPANTTIMTNNTHKPI